MVRRRCIERRAERALAERDPEIAGSEVSQLMLLEVSPNVFERIQFRSVGGQVKRFNFTV